MKVVSFVNNKGGVGKTTSAATTILTLRSMGYQVTGFDLDAEQGSLVLLLPTDTHLVRPRDLAKMIGQYRRSDFVVVDTPPSLGEHIEVANQVSDGLVICLTPEILSLRGLANLLTRIDQSKVLGLLVVGRRRTLHHQTILDSMKETGFPVLSIVPHSISVPDSWALSDGPLSYRPAVQMGIPQAYQKLAEEVIRWADKTQQGKHGK